MSPRGGSAHLTQYFEMFGNRGVYREGWLAGTVHRAPWETTRLAKGLWAAMAGISQPWLG